MIAQRFLHTRGRTLGVVIALVALLSTVLNAQTPPRNQLPTRLPEAVLQQTYRVELSDTLRVPSSQWRIAGGRLPAGLTMDPGGGVHGIPTESGVYRLQVEAADPSDPQRVARYQLELTVTAPLVIRWSQPPRVEGDHILGELEVTNRSQRTVDLTVLVVAVNEIGKAFALGYQHFPFNPGPQAIPFDSSLPRGSYVVHADAVGEIAAIATIYRARQQTPESLAIP